MFPSLNVNGTPGHVQIRCLLFGGGGFWGGGGGVQKGICSVLYYNTNDIIVDEMLLAGHEKEHY